MSTERSYNPMSMNGICPVCKKNPGKLMLNQYGPCSSCVPIPISVSYNPPPPVNLPQKYKYRFHYSLTDYTPLANETIANKRFSFKESVEWICACLNSGIIQPNRPQRLNNSTLNWGSEKTYLWDKNPIPMKPACPNYYIIREQMYG